MLLQNTILRQNKNYANSNKSRTTLLIWANQDIRNMQRRSETKLNSKDPKDYEKEFSTALVEIVETTFHSSNSYMQSMLSSESPKYKIDQSPKEVSGYVTTRRKLLSN